MVFPFVAGTKSVLWYVNRNSGFAILYHDFRGDQKKGLHELLSSVLVRLCRQYGSCSDFPNSIWNTKMDLKFDFQVIANLSDVYGNYSNFQDKPLDALNECSNASALPSPREKKSYRL